MLFRACQGNKFIKDGKMEDERWKHGNIVI